MSATVIAAHTRLLGSIEAEGDLVVEGAVEGSVRASGQLTLGRHAKVTGDIDAHDVRISGTLIRSVRAQGIIHLTATAEVRGDLDASRVVIDDGALFEGQVRLRRGAASGPTRQAPSALPQLPYQEPARTVPPLATPGRRRLQRRTI